MLVLGVLLVGVVVSYRLWNGRNERKTKVAGHPSGEVQVDRADIPPAPSADIPRENPNAGFQEAARESGIAFRMAFLPREQGEIFKINLYDHGCGVAIADFDADGFDDIYFVNQLGPNALYRNLGQGTFADVTKTAGVGIGDRICVGATFADFNNDGLPDLFVTSTRGGNVLFKNLGRGKFLDITEQAGLTLVAHSQTAVFFDYDVDGYLDLFVTCTARWTSNRYDAVNRYYEGPGVLWDMVSSPKEYNVLYRNQGNGTFTDVTEQTGLKGQGWAGDAAVFDFNEDGHLDVLVTNMFGLTQLYKNLGNGTFTDVTADTIQRTSWGAIGSKAFDYNNDGRLDLLLVDMHSDMWALPNNDPDFRDFVSKNESKRFLRVTGPADNSQPVANDQEERFVDTFQIQYDKVVFGNTMFKNLGQGKFEEVSEKAGLESFWPWGIAAGDFNNDGFEDVFIPSGMGYPYFYWPNRLFMNNGNETFAERSHEEGIEPPRHGIHMDRRIGTKPAPRSSRCAAVADFRGSGRLDIVTNNFNDHPYYFQNKFPPKNYIAFDLQGTKSNRDAVGALVRIYLGNEVQARQVHPAGGYLSQSSRKIHVGLGDRTNIDRVEIRWPSGRIQQVDRPTINQLHKIVEAE